jgi:hypothetical protein
MKPQLGTHFEVTVQNQLLLFARARGLAAAVSQRSEQDQTLSRNLRALPGRG